jgi:hypothetical protein
MILSPIVAKMMAVDWNHGNRSCRWFWTDDRDLAIPTACFGHIWTVCKSDFDGKAKGRKYIVLLTIQSKAEVAKQHSSNLVESSKNYYLVHSSTAWIQGIHHLLPSWQGLCNQVKGRSSLEATWPNFEQAQQWKKWGFHLTLFWTC